MNSAPLSSVVPRLVVVSGVEPLRQVPFVVGETVASTYEIRSIHGRGEILAACRDPARALIGRTPMRAFAGRQDERRETGAPRAVLARSRGNAMNQRETLTDRYETPKLRTRLVILEAALASIDRECERALDEPTVVFMTMCRVAALTRQALARELNAT